MNYCPSAFLLFTKHHTPRSFSCVLKHPHQAKDIRCQLGHFVPVPASGEQKCVGSTSTSLIYWMFSSQPLIFMKTVRVLLCWDSCQSVKSGWNVLSVGRERRKMQRPSVTKIPMAWCSFMFIVSGNQMSPVSITWPRTWYLNITFYLKVDCHMGASCKS